MAGRPKRTFSEKEIEQIKSLARCHCPDSEIAAFTGIPERTIQRHFGAVIKTERESGRASIRAKQFRLAMDGDKTMLVWLGKQLLHQWDRHNNLNHFTGNLELSGKAKLIKEEISKLAALEKEIKK